VVAAWDFERIIPSHLDGPIDAGPREFAEVRVIRIICERESDTP